VDEDEVRLAQEAGVDAGRTERVIAGSDADHEDVPAHARAGVEPAPLPLVDRRRRQDPIDAQGLIKPGTREVVGLLLAHVIGRSQQDVEAEVIVDEHAGARDGGVEPQLQEHHEDGNADAGGGEQATTRLVREHAPGDERAQCAHAGPPAAAAGRGRLRRHGSPATAPGGALPGRIRTSTVMLVRRSTSLALSRSMRTSTTRASARAAGSTLSTSFLKIM